ncbi:MAG: response regulator [Chloroflexota bacterium]
MRILVAYDGTLNAKDVLRYGVFRAKTKSGELHVLHVIDSASLVEYEGLNAEEKAKRESEHYLDEVKKIIDEAGKGLRVSFITIEGDPKREIVDYIRDNRIDLLLVPQRHASIAREAPCQVSVVPRDFSTFKVLLVDDEEMFVKSLSMRLNLRNLKTEVVMDGEQALSFVNKFDPDIIVLDLRMPGMDGIEVLKKTKESHPDTQIIILSGKETPKDREDAKRYGAFDFVTKPADIDMLAGKVKEAYWTKIEKPPTAFAEESGS